MMDFLGSDSVTARLFIVVGALALAVVGAALVVQWRKVRQTELELAFRKELLERGLAISEVERLLETTRVPDRTVVPPPRPPQPPPGSGPTAAAGTVPWGAAVVWAGFKGLALLLAIIMGGAALHSFAFWFRPSQQNHRVQAGWQNLQPPRPGLTLTPERPVVGLEAGRSGCCRIVLPGRRSSSTQLTAVITAQDNPQGELRLEIPSASRLAHRKNLSAEVKLHAARGTGNYTVKVMAFDRYRKLGEASFLVAVRPPAGPVDALPPRPTQQAAGVLGAVGALGPLAGALGAVLPLAASLELNFGEPRA